GDGGASGEGQPRRAAFYSQRGGGRAPEGRCSTPAEDGRPPLDERRDALGEVRRPPELLLHRGLELELLRHPPVQPVVELALGAGVREGRSAREPLEQRVGLGG